jgi:hypothetical protein
VTGDATARSWAIKAGIPSHELDEAVKVASQLGCDLLFSIGNYAIVPDALLECARRMSVNYHYGPLPKYSRVYAPSWAIADRVAFGRKHTDDINPFGLMTDLQFGVYNKSEYHLLDQNLDDHYERVEHLYERIEKNGEYVLPSRAKDFINALSH